jgi:hypothetical protein
MGVPIPTEHNVPSQDHGLYPENPPFTVISDDYGRVMSNAIEPHSVSPFLFEHEIVNSHMVYAMPPDFSQHQQVMEVDQNSSQVLPGVSIRSGVTIMDYGSDRHLSGRLIGHHRTIAYSEPAPNTFHHKDLVYIEDFFGTRYLGYLLGPVWADPARLAYFNAEGMPLENPGCPHHGRSCVMGQYLSASSQEQER